jgi:hypothetical protein
MTRSDILSGIQTDLEALDEDALADAAHYVRTLAAPPLRPLSERERDLLAQSRADFAAGRTLTLGQVRKSTDALFARYRSAQKRRKRMSA